MRRVRDPLVRVVRAVNTGGRRLTNDELMRPFADHGLDDVAAYQAAGNLTFTRPGDAPIDVAELEAALALAYGFDAPGFRSTASATPGYRWPPSSRRSVR